MIISLLSGHKLRVIVLGHHIWYIEEGKLHHQIMEKKYIPTQIVMYENNDKNFFILFWSHVIFNSLIIVIGLIIVALSTNLYVSSFALAITFNAILILYSSFKSNNYSDGILQRYRALSTKDAKHAFYLNSDMGELKRLDKSYASIDENLFAFTYSADLTNQNIFLAHMNELQRLDALGKEDVVLERLLTLSKMNLGSFQQKQIDNQLMIKYAFYTKTYDQLEPTYKRLLSNPKIGNEKQIETTSIIIYQYFVLNNKEVAKALYLEQVEKTKLAVKTGAISSYGNINTQIQSLFNEENQLDDHIQIGSTIKAIREKQQKTIAYCANALQISEDLFQSWELNERFLNANELIKVAEFFHVNIKDLIFEVTARKSQEDKRLLYSYFLTYLVLLVYVLMTTR